MNLFPASAAILLRKCTWMSDIAITNWLRNYGKGGHSEGVPLRIVTSTPGLTYRFRYVNGVWRFTEIRHNFGVYW